MAAPMARHQLFEIRSPKRLGAVGEALGVLRGTLAPADAE